MYQNVMTNRGKKADEGNTFSLNYIVAIGGITGGFLLMLSGLILWAMAFFSNTNFNGWEVILLVTAFVFLGIGAHFMDKYSVADKALETKPHNKNGLAVEQSETYESADKSDNLYTH